MGTMTRILMIDDDAKLISLLGGYLKGFQMEVEGIADGTAGWERLRAGNWPDLVILDITLPGIDGFEVCRRIRSLGDLPVIMLSARGEAVDRIVGLELGADDYLSKPFEPRELVSRVQSVLRRTGRPSAQGRLRFDGLALSAQSREAYDGADRPLGLTSLEFELLWLLAGAPGRKFSRDEILATLQGSSAETLSRAVDVLVSRLRSKLGDDPKTPRFIKSARGWGYVFLGRPL
jgi:DNA-binding response OmpR family regulator